MKNVIKLILLFLSCVLCMATASFACVLIVAGFISLVLRQLPNALVCVIATAVLTVIFSAILFISMAVSSRKMFKQMEATKKKGEELLKEKEGK